MSSSAGGGRFGPEQVFLGILVSAITLPVSISVDVKDPGEARAILLRLLSRFEEASNARRGRPWWDGVGVHATALEPYRGVELGVVTLRFFFLDFHLHHAFVGKRLVLATQRWVITELIDALETAKDGGAGEPSNLLLELRPGAFERARGQFALVWQERMQEACFANFPALEVLLAAGGAGPARLAAECELRLGYVPFCPAGGAYSFGAGSGLAACSVHRHPLDPRAPREARGDEPFIAFLESLRSVRAAFRFTEEGVRTRIAIERRQGGRPK